jgi:hypothetical protein
MKNTIKTSLLLAAAGLIWVGCGDNSGGSGSAGTGGGMDSGGGSKESAPVAAAVESAAKAAVETTKSASQEVVKAVEAAKPQLQEAAKAVQDAAADVGAAAQAKFNEVVAEVKKLISEGKGSDALAKVNSLFSNLKLTPEQQKTLEDLKKQAQEALSKSGVDSAAKAVGDLLKPKPQN